MTITAADVLTRARQILIDPDAVRWPDAELLNWLSDGLRAVLSVRPDVFGVITTETLAAGTKQTLPAPAYLLLGILRNVHADNTPGRAVRLISREVLDALNPDWHSMTPTDEVRHYVYDSSFLTTYFVYPPNTGAGKLDISYASMPDVVTDSTNTLPLPDNYLIPLTDYVLFRAHMKDSDNPNASVLANTYFSAFTQFVGASAQSQASANVNLGLQPGDKPPTLGAPQ